MMRLNDAGWHGRQLKTLYSSHRSIRWLTGNAPLYGSNQLPYGINRATIHIQKGTPRQYRM
jgi:hypothetical protein